MTAVDMAPAKVLRHRARVDPGDEMLEPSEVPDVECIGGPQRQSDAVQRNRIIATDGFQSRDRRSAIDKIVFAVDLEPTDVRSLGADAGHMREAQTDARGGG